MERIASSRPRVAVFASIVAVLFGLLTIKSGGAVLFFDGPARAAAGAYVPFVLWFNFFAGFVYIIAGAGLFGWRGWAITLSWLLATATVIVFIALGFHVLVGGDFEARTVGAMTLRSVVWLSIAFFTRKAWIMG